MNMNFLYCQKNEKHKYIIQDQGFQIGGAVVHGHLVPKVMLALLFVAGHSSFSHFSFLHYVKVYIREIHALLQVVSRNLHTTN